MPKKILFVDDEPDILMVSTFRLKSMGYEVITAEDGRKALDIVRSQPVDLIFLDLRLPVIDGIEICKLLKADQRLKKIPIILFTASTGCMSDIAQGCGADDIMFKPFESEELVAKVKKMIG